MRNPQDKALLSAFGKRLQDLRREKGLTQEQLAAAIDIHVVTLARLETGKRWIGLPTLRKIASTLGVQIKDLFEGVN